MQKEPPIGEPVSEPKNKGGRPRRAPGEKLQRVTLNLRPKLMFGLELVARDRQTSLSQAAEHLLSLALREYAVDGRSVMLLLDMLSEQQDRKGKSQLTGDQWVQLMLASKGGKAMVTPVSLMTPADRAFMEAVNAQPNDRDFNPLPFHRPDMVDELYQVVTALEQSGMSKAEIAAVAKARLQVMWHGHDEDEAKIARDKKPRARRG
jgi:hypothetical protein